MRLRSVLLAALFLMSAAAQEKPRHIDFTQPLLGVDGKSIPIGDLKKPDAMTLGDAALGALEASLDTDKQLSGADKFKQDQLARKVYGKRDAILTVEEIALIKTRVGQAYGPMVVGAVWRVLDPASN